MIWQKLSGIDPFGKGFFVAARPIDYHSNQHADNGCRKVRGEQSANHRAHSESGQIASAVRRETANPADLDGNAAEIGETAQGVSGQSETALVKLRVLTRQI